MIKFFRKIRYNLMSENKTGKYLKYAIGEIILVMIGILLALQVSNWNEEQKNFKKEKAILTSLKSELKTNLDELKFDHKSQLFYYQATMNVYQYIQSKPVLVDSMYSDFNIMVGFNYFFPKTSIYETLKSGSLEIIKSNSIRESITDIYESHYQRIISKVDTRRNAARVLFPYYQKHFRTKHVLKNDTISFRQKLGIPNNYEFLINDPEFETLIAEAIDGRNHFVDQYLNAITEVEKGIKLIDAYLIKNEIN